MKSYLAFAVYHQLFNISPKCVIYVTMNNVKKL